MSELLDGMGLTDEPSWQPANRDAFPMDLTSALVAHRKAAQNIPPPVAKRAVDNKCVTKMASDLARFVDRAVHVVGQSAERRFPTIVGVTGNRGFIPEFQQVHVTAGRVAPFTGQMLR